MAEQQDESEALTPQEVADILKITKNTVYELIKRGELNGYRVGKKVRVDRRDVDAYKNATRGKTGQAAYCPVVAPEGSLPTRDSIPGLHDHASGQETAGRISGNFVICGQDSVLDILARNLERYRAPGENVLRAYTGSYNALISLYNDEIQLAAIHLWDGETNEYNVPYVRRLLPGTRAVIIHLVCRMAGLYVREGNPKGIRGWEDLARKDVSIVNRERGSGTRVLLDEHMRKLGIDAQTIQGYHRECLTHLAAAGTVARGGADIAIGCENAMMQVRGLEFIPLQKERYELVLKRENLGKPLFETAIRIIRSPEFREEISSFGGYDASETGALIAET